MSSSGDAAEQIVRMTLESTEVAARITGKGAERIARMLYAVLRDQKQTKGRTRLVNMLRSRKELRIFSVKDPELAKFCREAKRYGILYCVLKDKDVNDRYTDIMVRAEDAGKVSRIFERFGLSTLDMASVRSETGHAQEEPMEEPMPERGESGKKRSRADIFLDALLSDPDQEKREPENPTRARGGGSPPSVPTSSTDRQSTDRAPSAEEKKKQPSVRQELQELREEIERERKTAPAPETKAHGAPKKKRKQQEIAR